MHTKKDKRADDFILSFFESISLFFYNYFRSVGIYTKQFSLQFKKIGIRIYNRFFIHHVEKMLDFLSDFKNQIFQIQKLFMFKVYIFIKFFIDAKDVVKNGYNNSRRKSTFSKIDSAILAFFKGVKNNKNIVLTFFNYALPIIAVFVFSKFVLDVKSINYGVFVEYNGQELGYIEDEHTFDRAENRMQARMNYLEEDEKIDVLPKFSLAIVSPDELKSELELTDDIIKSSSTDIVQATGLSVDGEFYGAVEDGAKLEEGLNNLLNTYKTSKAGEEVQFAKEVKTETGLFVSKNVKPEDEILSLITNKESTDVYYTVKSGDTPIKIANKYNMNIDELTALNKGILNNLKVGAQVLVKKSETFLPVSVKRIEVYEKPISYTTEYVDSNRYFKGFNLTTREGKNGIQEVTAKVEYVDGVEIGREVIETQTINQPVAKKVTRGTMPIITASNSSGNVSSSGFIWPVTGGYISSSYGYRWGNFHSAIDIAGRGNFYGKPIVAALPGRVIYSGWSGSYGKIIKIDHGGGLQTWYAHCSTLGVNVGQNVAQGQYIGNVGSTGNSTGNHLHFEVKLNGVSKNPLNYLP